MIINGELLWVTLKQTFLPSYVGVGNGITRGYGTIFGFFNKNQFNFGDDKLKNISTTQEPLEIDGQSDLEVISALDVPKPKRKEKRKNVKLKERTNLTKTIKI